MVVTMLPLLGTDVVSVEEGVDDGDVELVVLDEPALCVTLLSLVVLVLVFVPVDGADNDTELMVVRISPLVLLEAGLVDEVDVALPPLDCDDVAMAVENAPNN